MAGFSVNIGANTSQLTGALAQVKKDLTGLRFPANFGRLPLQDINAFKASVQQLKTEIATGLVPGIKNIPPAAGNVGDSLRKITPGANQAAFALTNVGRVAQDLPFGFLGIQNNLNPLLESFQRLRAETGSSKAAFAALGSSLIGPAGIGIALSVVSAAILIYQNGINGFNKKTKEAKDKADEFIKTLKDVQSVTDEAAASQQGNIAQVKALAGVIQDTNNSYEERKRALNDLKQINKSYFGDLTLEESKMALLTSRVNEYTQALVQQAVVKGFTDEISRVSVELAKQDKALKASRDNLERLENQLANTKESETSLTGEDRVSGKYIKAKNAVEDAEKAFIGQRDIVEKLQTNYAELSGAIDEAVKQSLKFKSLDTGQKEIDQLSKRLAALEKIKDSVRDINVLTEVEEQIFDLKVRITLRDAAKNGLSKKETDLLIDGFRRDLTDAFNRQALAFEAIPKVKVQSVQLVDITTDPIESKIAKAAGLDKKIPEITIRQVRVKLLGIEVANAIEQAEKAAEDLRKVVVEAFTSAIVDASALLGDTLGSIFSGKDLGQTLAGFAQGFLGIIGGVLQQIGKQMIVASTLIQSLKKILGTVGFGAASLGLGFALVAFGGALKNVKFGEGTKFAEGGIVTGPTRGVFGEAGPEAVIPLSRLPQIIGQANQQSSGGGAFTATIVDGGRDLILLMERAQRTFDRNF